MKVSVLQSNFLPWRGYFDLINSVDKFILYDCVQYTKNDWRNRNKIQSKNGVHWLTLQVEKPYSWCKINEVLVIRSSLRRVIASLEISYKKAKYFDIVFDIIIRPLLKYSTYEHIYLSELNFDLICNISRFFNIKCDIQSTIHFPNTNFMDESTKTKRLIRLLSEVGASSYLSGPSAMDYLSEESSLFESHSIGLEYIKYPSYSTYSQFSDEFVPNLSIVDFIAHVGNSSNPFL